jgi:hypothetical protein
LGSARIGVRMWELIRRMQYKALNQILRSVDDICTSYSSDGPSISNVVWAMMAGGEVRCKLRH